MISLLRAERPETFDKGRLDDVIVGRQFGADTHVRSVAVVFQVDERFPISRIKHVNQEEARI